MKIAIIMNHNSYLGREYIQALKKADIHVDIISIGNYPSRNAGEDKRCRMLWNPIPFEKAIKDLSHFNFNSLKEVELVNFLKKQKYDLGIQGGTGIISKSIFDKFKLGILNFHPGNLPGYRGCSAPEWQIYERFPVVATCHLIDEKVDTGPIYKKKKLSLDYRNYSNMRASIYPEISKFVIEIVSEIMSAGKLSHALRKQNEKKAVYRKYIGEDKIDEIKNILDRGFVC